jgi:hypothetical protein
MSEGSLPPHNQSQGEPPRDGQLFKIQATAVMKDIELANQFGWSLQASEKQILMLAVLSSGVLLPVLVGVSAAAAPGLVATILLFLSIMFWAMAYAYFGYAKQGIMVARYLEGLSGLANSLLALPKDHDQPTLFGFEVLLRDEWQKGIPSKLLISLWPAGEITIVALPGIGALAAFFYIQQTTPLPWEPLYTVLVGINGLVLAIGAAMGISAGVAVIKLRR